MVLCCKWRQDGLEKWLRVRISNMWSLRPVNTDSKIPTPPIVQSIYWFKASERIEFIIMSFTYKILNTTQPPYLYDLVSVLSYLLMVTTRALHLTSLWSSHHHHSESLIAPSHMLHLIFGTSSLHLSEFLIRNNYYSSPSQRPSFEHAGLTCYTLLPPSITFSLFHSELKTYLFKKYYPPS